MKIGHISDLHILSLKGTKFYEFFNKRIIGGANLLFNRKNEYKIEFIKWLIEDINKKDLDYLVITGDLTNLALVSEFKKVVELLSTLKIAKERIIVIPGNHDNYTKSAYKKKLFAKYMKPWMANHAELKDGEEWPIVRVVDDILITGFSSSISSCPFCSAGKISKRQLEVFDDFAKKNSDKFKINLLHHHLPELTKRKKFMDGLRNREEVLEYFSENKIDMVLHGHKHKNSHYKVNFNNYDINVYEAGASGRLSINHEGNWSIYNIENKKLVSTEKRFLDFKTKKYIIK